MDVSFLNGALFYVFSAVLLLSGLASVIAKSSVHSVLLLILAFFSAAWVFIGLNAEFIAMLLIIIYVGAVAVLFIFVVMMLEEPKAELKKRKLGLKFVFNFIFGSVLFVELFVILITVKNMPRFFDTKVFTIKDIGNILYTEYFYEFQTMGLLFFTAMIGAIVLTLEKSSPNIKKQIISDQIKRDSSSVELVNPEFKKGVKIT
jgi:NADH-quinone oxidoreductase subunit J